jgi:hypothetical protein
MHGKHHYADSAFPLGGAALGWPGGTGWEADDRPK